MRKSILIFFLTCFIAPFGKAQNGFWMGSGLGIAFGESSVMAHADVSATYLRYNRWGFSGHLQANGRTISNSISNSLKSFTGYGIQFAYNFVPYNESGLKLIGRVGGCHGSGIYVNEYISSYQNADSSGTSDVIYNTSEYSGFGAEVSIEFLFNYRENRALSFQLYTVLMRYPFGGFSLRYSIGKLD